MGNVIVLAKRSMLLFIRDRAAVFFSFLSSIIIVALYLMFIAKLYSEGMSRSEYIASHFAKPALDFVVYTQMMAGVLIINSWSLSIGVFSTIVKDFETRRVDSFQLTPATAPQLILSYFGSGFLVSFLLNIFTWLISFILIGALTGYRVSIETFFAVIGVCALASLVSCAVMMMLTAIIKSSAAIGVMAGVSGTFFGFLCGIYLPFSNLGKGMEMAGSVLPFTHLTIWMKEIVLGDAYSQLGIPGELKSVMNENFSAANVGFLSFDIPLWTMLLYTAAFAVICFAVSGVLTRRRLAR
ncbi:MAG: ABC transporter permease [Clostridiales Family XIII bacterium]|jgi:multidrug/hemolysin transport system permease protein|nr:ABC transporter permease [Clostridiales Family XIII bacterium]